MKCPVCETVWVARRNMTGSRRAPQAGHPSICGDCLTIFIHLSENEVRVITPDEWNALPDDLREAIQADRLQRMERRRASLN